MQEYKSNSYIQQETAQPKFAPSDLLGVFAIIADVLVTLFIIVGMAQDKNSVTVSVLSGVAFFFAFGALVVLVLSGTLSAILIARMREVTIRQQSGIHQPQRLTLVDPLRIEDREAAHPLALGSGTYVPALAEPDDSTRREALLWLASLYQADGTPDPKRVLMQSNKERPGRIRIGAPSAPAKEFLLGRRIIRDIGTGYMLNLAKVPTISVAQRQLV